MNTRSKESATGIISVKETSIVLLAIFYKSQIEALKFLVYNLIMKKIVLLISIFMFAVGSAFADDMLNEKINILYAENNIKEAFNNILSIDEDNRTEQNWILAGNILQDQGKLEDAVFMYNRAIILNEKSYKAHYNLGNIYLEQEKPFLAIEEFKKAVKYNPDFAYGYYNLGCAYIKTGKLKTAKWQFLKAIDLNNQIADFHYNLAYTYQKLNNEKQAKVYLDYYNKLMERGQ